MVAYQQKNEPFALPRLSFLSPAYQTKDYFLTLRCGTLQTGVAAILLTLEFSCWTCIHIRLRELMILAHNKVSGVQTLVKVSKLRT